MTTPGWDWVDFQFLCGSFSGQIQLEFSGSCVFSNRDLPSLSVRPPRATAITSIVFSVLTNTWEEVFQVVCSYLQTHTQWLWTFKSLGSVLQRLRCLLGMDNIKNCFMLFYSTEKAGFREGIWHACFLQTQVCLFKSFLQSLCPGSDEQPDKDRRVKQNSWRKDTVLENKGGKLFPMEITNSKV